MRHRSRWRWRRRCSRGRGRPRASFPRPHRFRRRSSTAIDADHGQHQDDAGTAFRCLPAVVLQWMVSFGRLLFVQARGAYGTCARPIDQYEHFRHISSHSVVSRYRESPMMDGLVRPDFKQARTTNRPQMAASRREESPEANDYVNTFSERLFIRAKSVAEGNGVLPLRKRFLRRPSAIPWPSFSGGPFACPSSCLSLLRLVSSRLRRWSRTGSDSRPAGERGTVYEAYVCRNAAMFRNTR